MLTAHLQGSQEALLGALRREAAAEARCQALQAELAGVHQLARGREQELRQNAMVLKLRAGQIERLQVPVLRLHYFIISLTGGPVLLLMLGLQPTQTWDWCSLRWASHCPSLCLLWLMPLSGAQLQLPGCCSVSIGCIEFRFVSMLLNSL